MNRETKLAAPSDVTIGLKPSAERADSKAKTLCMVSESTGPYNAIGKVAMAQVQAALEAGWRVSVVAKRLHESLQDRVEWLKLYVPPRGFALQWLTGRFFIKKALGNRRFDVIHGHQPQIADLCDVYQCHFLTRSAYERNCLYDGKGLRRIVDVMQKKLVLRAEDRFYRNWNVLTIMVFVSDLLRTEFARFYGIPDQEQVVPNPSLPARLPTLQLRRSARQFFFGRNDERLVIGYLGGKQNRKGFWKLLDGVASVENLHLLLGGPNVDSFTDARCRDRIWPLGLVEDIDRFYAACDAVVVPSVFDPCPVVVMEAVSRGVPVIATDGVGNLPDILRYGAGLAWDGSQPLQSLLQQIVTSRSMFEAGAKAMTAALSETEFLNRIKSIWALVVERGR